MLRTAVVVALVSRLALVVLVAWLRGPEAFTVPDTNTYSTPAASLVEAFEFTNSRGHPELFRTPGYPLVLVPGVLAGHPVLVALVLQLAFSGLLVVLVFRLAHRIAGDERVAGLCALTAALDPTMLLWSVKVLPETLFTTLLAGCALTTLRVIETARDRLAALAALLLAATIYVKPIAYPLVGILFVFLLAARGPANARRWRPAVVFVVLCAALLAPWHFRNLRTTGYAGFSTLAEHAMYLSAGGSVTARQDGAPYADVRARLIEAVEDEPDSTRFGSMWRHGWRVLRTDQGGYARTHLQGIARTLFDPAAVEYLRLFGAYPEGGGALVRAVDRGLVTAVREWAHTQPAAFWSSAVLASVPFLLLGTAAVAAARRSPWRRSVFVLSSLLASYFVVAGGGVPGSSRFRVPATPFLIVMAAAALRRPTARDALQQEAPAHRLPR